MERLYGFGQLQPPGRAAKLMGIANNDLQKVLDIAPGAGLIEKQR